ncbi:hypothetical protein [Streptomyces sp. IBSBF 2435]|uniref:hypothetical protein n=1 Tax=Streptomyces sp. IBSBF 2435 TaxID=2903531 RepID=UPI002FDC4F23
MAEAAAGGPEEDRGHADRAAWAVDLLLHFATSTAAEQSTREGSAAGADEDDALTVAVLTAFPSTHPHVAALGPELFTGAGEARMTWAFHVLINGILQTPRPAA